MSPGREFKQEWQGFAVAHIVATQPEVDEQVPEASISLPTDWLMTLVDEDLVRRSQRPDTVVRMAADGLTLSGVELVVERRWLREPYWHQIGTAVTRGFIHTSSAVKVTLRGDRRQQQRRPSRGAAR